MQICKALLLVAATFALAGCQTTSTAPSTEQINKIGDKPREYILGVTPLYEQHLQYSSETPSTSQISDEQAFTAAHAAVRANLKDPDSAKFGTTIMRKTVIMTDTTFAQPNFPVDKFTDIVCGTINAKNGFGGYTGAAVFAYRIGRHDVFIDESREWNWGGKWCIEAKQKRTR